MRIESLELFIAVAQCGSVSVAAQRRFISQQGASKAIRSLEQELGCTLFERTRGGLQLTPVGERLLPEAAAIVESHHRMQSIAAAAESFASVQQLEIVTTPFITNQLSELFANYEALMPNVRLRIIERSPFKIVEEFYGEPNAEVERQADDPEANVVTLVAVPFFMERIVKRVRGDFIPLAVSELMATATAGGPLEGVESVTPGQLCGYPLAFYNEEFLNRLIKHLFAGLDPDIRMRTSNIGMLNRAITHEGMVTFTDSLSAFLGQGDGSCVPIENGVLFAVGVLGRPEPDTPAGRFVSYARRYFDATCASYMRHYDNIAENPFAEVAAAPSVSPSAARECVQHQEGL